MKAMPYCCRLGDSASRARSVTVENLGGLDLYASRPLRERKSLFLPGGEPLVEIGDRLWHNDTGTSVLRSLGTNLPDVPEDYGECESQRRPYARETTRT